ncbi:hypothetical protein [Neisseria gonorrhoeae]|uniref:hypothetical protein n=1 Tax=Neisseria gonorrhoeae TaxID=485 RepID=UPI0033415F93
MRKFINDDKKFDELSAFINEEIEKGNPLLDVDRNFPKLRKFINDDKKFDELSAFINEEIEKGKK